MITGVLAQATVTDLERSREWYDRVLDRPADAEPMPGLIEYHLGTSHGVQVWQEPERAGRCSLVLLEADLPAAAVRLRAAGIANDGPEPISSGRVVQLLDPDGNRVVFVGA